MTSSFSQNSRLKHLWYTIICIGSLLYIFSCCAVSGENAAPSQPGLISTCRRDHENTIGIHRAAIAKINDYLEKDNPDSDPTIKPGALLRQISDIIWPAANKQEWYCIDKRINGIVGEEVQRNCTDILEGFRNQIGVVLRLADQPHPLPTSLGRALQELHVNISFFHHTFLKVLDVEAGSLFLREFSLLLMGSSAEYIRYCKSSNLQNELERHQQRSLPPTAYIMAKYSYFFLRFMPKKMSDYLSFSMQASRNIKLSIVNRLDDQVLKEYIEPSSHYDLDTNEGKTFAFGLLKVARITMKKRLEKYWNERLNDYRYLLFRRYCTAPACHTEREQYDEFVVTSGQPVTLGYLSGTAENGKLCSSDLCSSMWLSTAGYKDYVYYRGTCMDAAHPLETTDPQACDTEYWKLCTDFGRCNSGQKHVLKDSAFPIVILSNTSGLCVDCTDTEQWCRQNRCPSSALFPGYPSRPVGDIDNCLKGSHHCEGPQFQLHILGKSKGSALEILDEALFSYGGPVDKYYRFLRAEIFSGSVFRTQHYAKVTQKHQFINNTVGFEKVVCPLDKEWSTMEIAEQVICAQSLYTVMRPIDAERILHGDPS
ncbi:uncharacterized protein LOC129583642 [Paramacrobiotus metropolitanus]|uniref:uncharacterized protein LOC129583642 n=1 Tax=Paramacrobiotus metropolitanus TaxID=2943436 RepID=UPI0024464EFF|nr:uncharacterized protein LOC129583642 [Paramacrobiotus metropolitanus]